jgi:hypothetical protein
MRGTSMSNTNVALNMEEMTRCAYLEPDIAVVRIRR